MEFHSFPKSRTILASMLLVLIFCIGAFAQGTSELTGVINDPTGAVVPNIEVKLTNTATGIERTTVTSAAGIYRFPALPVVGTYTLSIDARGFKKTVVQNIVPSVGTTVTKDVKLEVGSTSETISVEAGAELVQTSESSVSQLVDNRVWQQMPLETRNQNEFIKLLPGAVTQEFSGNNRGASVNGTRGGSGNFMVEGQDNNDQGQGGRGQISDASGGAITGITPEAIQEYRVITNSFPAEYGKAGGFVTDTVLKSGTNQYHGSLFEYNRVQALAANNFFSNRSIDPQTGKTLQDSVVRNQFGGSFGGALVKDKTFFYSTVEIHRRRDQFPTTTTSTTQEFLDFVNSDQFANFLETSPNGFCNNQGWLDYEFGAGEITAAPCQGAFSNSRTLGSVFNKLSAKGPFPLAQRNFSNQAQGFWTAPDATADWAGIQYPVPVYGQVTVRDAYGLNENKFTLKFDHKLSTNDQLSASYLFDDGDQITRYGYGDTTIGPGNINPGRSQNLGISWNHTFSPTVLNTFKVGYLRHVQQFPVQNGYEGIPSVYTAFDPLGVGFGQTSGLPQFFTDNQFQYQDHLSFVRGKHAVKTGFEYRRTRNGSSFNSYEYGDFAPYGVEDLVTDLNFGDDIDNYFFGEPAYGSAYSAIASINPQTGTRPDYYRGFRANEFAAYIQDDYRVNNRLTLNYGVRWEYFGPPHNFKPGMDSNFFFGSSTLPITNGSSNPYFPVKNPIVAGLMNGEFRITDSVWSKDKNNFGPRFGLAYDVFGNQKFVVRAGAGIMYDRIYNNVFENMRFNPPLFANAQLGYYVSGIPFGAFDGLYTDNFTEDYTAGFAGGNAKGSGRHVSQNLVSPYYEQFHAGFQYEPLKGYVVETEYVGTMGHKLTGIRDINTFDGRVASGVSSTRPNTTITADNYRSNDYNSNYHALQVSLRKAFSNGVQFNANYTWSKAMDTMSDAFNGKFSTQVTDVWNIKQDYGPADFDIRQRFVTSLTYDLPFLKNNRWLGGWSINTFLTANTGVGLTPYNSNVDTNKDGYRNDRLAYVGGGANPNVIANLDPQIGSSDSVSYFNPTAWTGASCPASVNGGKWCNGGWGRNSLRGPGFFNQDLGLSKKFKVNERTNLTFQGNFFNVWNHPSFNSPVVNASSPDFGNIISTANGARVAQLALRLEF